MTESEPVKRWETFLLYKRYLAVKKLPEEEYKKLVDGLVIVFEIFWLLPSVAVLIFK